MMFTTAGLVQIRFQRRGRKKLPFYRIVAIDTRKQRDGKPIEVRSIERASSSVLLKAWQVCELLQLMSGLMGPKAGKAGSQWQPMLLYAGPDLICITCADM